MSISSKWNRLCLELQNKFNTDIPDLKIVLFLIGIQELGRIPTKATKREKEEIFHVAMCTLLSKEGYYKFEKIDGGGWPHYRKIKEMPKMDVFEEEHYIKKLCIDYFIENNVIQS